MPDLYFGIIQQSAKNLTMPQSKILHNQDITLQFLRDLYNYTNENSNVKIMSRSIEFQSYGVVGAPGGEALLDMIWTASHMQAFFAKIINASSGFIIDGAACIFPFAEVVDNVYTANTATIGLTSKVVDTSSINNVTTLSWYDIKNNMPNVDIVASHLNFLTDYDILDSLLDCVNPGGLFILSNASNGSEMYHKENSFPEEVHNRILSRGDFLSFHLQGYISYTIFIKR